MSKNNRVSFAVCASALALMSCSTKTPTDGGGTRERDLLPGVKIVYSANIDGEIEPCGCRSNPTGGLNRRWNLMLQKVPGEKLQIDSGDLFFQSAPVPPFLQKQWQYQAHVLLMGYNALGVEVVAPGDLEFADGLAPFETLAKEAKFKFVSANIYRLSTGKRMFEPYVILLKGGKKVGIFGLYDEALPLPPELIAKDRIAAATEMVKELRSRADVVIALTHQGIDKDIELAKQVSGIDAIFGAHTQSFLHDPEKVGDTLIFQPSFRGQHIGVYENGENKMYQVDERFDSPPDQLNVLDKVVSDAKIEIARINKASEAELMGLPMPKTVAKVADAGFQTFTQCAQCHAAQYEFHKSSKHFQAFDTLVKAHQSANLECLTCHTVGAGKAEGWKSVNKLVLNSSGKPIDAANFSKSLPKMNTAALAKVSKAFINVQCENCHGMAGEHPMKASKMLTKAVAAETCLTCHTTARAPGWHKNGKPDMELIQAKLKSLSCPATKK